MSSSRCCTTLSGGHAISIRLQQCSFACIARPPCRSIAVVPRYGRRRLPVLAAKFTINTSRVSSSQQTVQTIPTAPAPSVQPAGSGLLPALAGGLLALTGVATLLGGVWKAKTATASGVPAAADTESNGRATAAEGAVSLAQGDAPVQAVRDTTVPGVAQHVPATQQGGQRPADGLAMANESEEVSELLRQQRQLELEQERARKVTSALQEELQNRERELLEAQREGSAQVAGARVELKESRRKAELLEAMVGALRERLRREEDRNAALEEEIELGREEMARFAGQRQELQERIEALRLELADTQAKLLVAQALAADLDVRVAQLRAQNTELELRVGELEAQLQSRTAAVAVAAASAEEKLRLMQAATDEDRLYIAKLQGKLAERESQLAVLREGESELQEVLEQSKAAAAQMAELLRQRDAELQRLQEALLEAEKRRLDQEKALNTQIAALESEREPELQRLQAAVKEAEARRLEEAGGMKKQLDNLRRLHEHQVQQLRDASEAAEQSAQAEIAALKEKLSGLQSERDKEVTLLNSQLQESARHAERLQDMAKAQAAAHEEEVQALRKQVEDAKLRAEQASARRVSEVSELRSALEQQLGSARQEALDARFQLAAVKEQLDGVLSDEWMALLEDELRQSILPGTDNTQPALKPSAVQGSPETVQELRSLDIRESALRRQLESLALELSELQSGAVARLGAAMVVRAQQLEAAAARCRKALQAREVVGDQQGIQRLTQQLSSLTSELAALYRSVMVPEARNRERAVRQELQAREMELRGVVEQQIRLQDCQEQEQRESMRLKEKAIAAASGPTQQQLRKVVQSRVKELLTERERQVQQQAAAREQQLQAQLRAAKAGSDVQQRELKAVQEAVEKQARLIEESWKVQLEASSRALKEAAADKQRLAAEVSRSSEQVRQQLAELETLRRELLAARSAVAALRRAAEDSRASAAQQSVGAAAEVQRLAAQVQQLQDALKERERQYATSSQGAVPPPQKVGGHGTRSVRPATPLTMPSGAAAVVVGQPSPLLPATQNGSAPARVPAASDVLIRRSTAAVTAAGPSASASVPVLQDATAATGAAAVQGAPAAAVALQSGRTAASEGGDSEFKPLTPVRPGWPVQYGGSSVPPPPSQSPPSTSAIRVPAVTEATAGLAAAASASASPAAATQNKSATSTAASPLTQSVPESAPTYTGNGNSMGNVAAKRNGTDYNRQNLLAGANSEVHNNGHDLAPAPAVPAAAAGVGTGAGTGPDRGLARQTNDGKERGNGVAASDGNSNSVGSSNLRSVQAVSALQAASSPAAPHYPANPQNQVVPADPPTASSPAQAANHPPDSLSPSNPAPAVSSVVRGAQDAGPAQQLANLATEAAAPGHAISGQQSDAPLAENGSVGELGGVAEGRQRQLSSPGTGLGSSGGAAVNEPWSGGQPNVSVVQEGSNVIGDTVATVVAVAAAQATTPPPKSSETGPPLRRSVPPGPYDSASFPAATVGPQSAPSTVGSSPSDAQALRPQSPGPPPAAAALAGSVDTSPPLAASSSPVSASLPTPPSPAASTRSSISSNVPPSASSSPPLVASGGVSINPMIGPASSGRPSGPATPSPSPVKPLTPLKVPTPADFGDFLRTSPAAPASASSSAGASAAGAVLPAPPPSSPSSSSPSPPPARAASPRQSAPKAPGPTTPPASPPASTSATTTSPPAKPKAPQSPAAAAMAAAAGAAEAARRAAAASAAGTPPTPKATGYGTPPITEWGRPKSAPEAADDANTSPSARTAAGSAGVSGASNITSSTTPFFSEAELGAEIAAIAQSLVQRTIGGGARSASSALSSLAPPPSPAAAAKAPTRGSAVTRRGGGGQPSAPSLTGPGAAAGVSAAGGINAGVAGTSSGTAAGVARRVQLSVAAYGVPHVAKADKGSEDAYFMATPSGGVVSSAAPGGRPNTTSRSPLAVAISALGVADGVGGWAEANVDPGQYSREIMDAAARAAEESGPGADPRQLLARAQDEVRTIGSCTACVAVLSNKAPQDKGPATSPSASSSGGSSCNSSGGGGEQVLSIANLGDSGCRVVRRGSLVLATSAQEHQFNMPYQMAHPDNLPDTDTAEDAQMYQLALEPGDVVILATDGLFDNMWDEELVSLAAAAAAAVPPGLAGPAASAAAQSAAQQLATSLVGSAFRHAQDPAFRSPWAVELANQPSASWISRMFPRGGKMDDITAVVAIVTAA